MLRQDYTGSRWSSENCALWNLCAELNVLLRVLEEVYEFHDFDFCFFASSNISKNLTIIKAHSVIDNADNSRKSNSNLVRIYELRCRLHNSTKEPAALATTATAHHVSRSSHHVDEKSDYQKRWKQSTQAGGFNLSFVDDRDVVHRLNVEIGLCVLQIPFEGVDAADVEPKHTIGDVASRELHSHPFLVDDFELLDDATGEIAETLSVAVRTNQAKVFDLLVYKVFPRNFFVSHLEVRKRADECDES